MASNRSTVLRSEMPPMTRHRTAVLDLTPSPYSWVKTSRSSRTRPKGCEGRGFLRREAGVGLAGRADSRFRRFACAGDRSSRAEAGRSQRDWAGTRALAKVDAGQGTRTVRRCGGAGCADSQGDFVEAVNGQARLRDRLSNKSPNLATSPLDRFASQCRFWAVAAETRRVDVRMIRICGLVASTLGPTCQPDAS